MECAIAAHRSSWGGTKPVAGSQARFSAKAPTKIIASQKFGSATPTDEKVITNLSTQVLGRLAASTPSGTPSTIEIRIA